MIFLNLKILAEILNLYSLKRKLELQKIQDDEQREAERLTAIESGRLMCIFNLSNNC